MTILGTSMPCGEKKERYRDGVACVSYINVRCTIVRRSKNALFSVTKDE